jgi:hypothetical protein
MCYPVKCKTCAKTTWAGDGQHIDMVHATVPAANWCPGHAKETKPPRGIFSKLFVTGSTTKAAA